MPAKGEAKGEANRFSGLGWLGWGAPGPKHAAMLPLEGRSWSGGGASSARQAPFFGKHAKGAAPDRPPEPCACQARTGWGP